MKRRISPATIIASAALFFSLGGASLAASRYLITSESQIKPNIRMALKGNLGPRGPQGIQGAQGIPGPQGSDGQDASSNTFDTVKFYYRFGNAVALSASQREATAIATCDSGDRVINGGFTGQGEIVTSDELFTVIPAEWHVTAHLDPTATDGSISVWLICAIRGT